MKKERYLDLMEQVTKAYSDSQIEAYLAQVREKGITEHGFPRLGANLGILIANGRMQDKKLYFTEIMDLCCAQIPNPPVLVNGMGNDFSVRELVLCLLELEKAQAVPGEKIRQWKAALSKIDPYKTYSVIPSVSPTAIGNWAAFNAVSEQARVYAGLGHTEDYIENAVESQLFSFEENGMYRDPDEPMVYDLVTRVQLSTALFLGYKGRNRQRLDAYLEKAGKLTFGYMLPSGEVESKTVDVTLAVNNSCVLASIDGTTLPAGAIPFAELDVAGEPIARRRWVDKAYNELGLVKSDIKVTLNGDGTATYTSDKLVLGVCLDLDGDDGELSDNFFDLYPGRPYTVKLGSKSGEVLYSYMG
jgi:hypothetical protein